MEEINRVISLICLASSKGGITLVVPYETLKNSYSEKIRKLGEEIDCSSCEKKHKVSKDIIKIYSKQEFEDTYKANFSEIKPTVVFDEVDVAEHEPEYFRTIEDFENFIKDIKKDIKIIKVSTAPNKSLTLKGEITDYFKIYNKNQVAKEEKPVLIFMDPNDPRNKVLERRFNSVFNKNVEKELGNEKNDISPQKFIEKQLGKNLDNNTLLQEIMERGRIGRESDRNKEQKKELESKVQQQFTPKKI